MKNLRNYWERSTGGLTQGEAATLAKREEFGFEIGRHSRFENARNSVVIGRGNLKAGLVNRMELAEEIQHGLDRATHEASQAIRRGLMSIKVQVFAGTDELGEPEEFTWDLFPVVDAQRTTHLNADGLPKVGTHIHPGMIVVGKIGKSRDFDALHQPTALEMHGLSFDEIRSRYGRMWKDSSLYADSETTGVVKEAYLEDCCGKKRAVVVLEGERASTPIVNTEASHAVSPPIGSP